MKVDDTPEIDNPLRLMSLDEGVARLRVPGILREPPGVSRRKCCGIEKVPWNLIRIIPA
jgi:hypothetical protein